MAMEAIFVDYLTVPFRGRQSTGFSDRQVQEDLYCGLVVGVGGVSMVVKDKDRIG